MASFVRDSLTANSQPHKYQVTGISILLCFVCIYTHVMHLRFVMMEEMQ